MAIRRQKTKLPVIGGHAVTIVRHKLRREIAKRTGLPMADIPRQVRLETVPLKYAPVINTGKDYAELRRQASMTRWQRLADKISRLFGGGDDAVRVGA